MNMSRVNGSAATTPSVDLDREQTARVDNALRTAINTGQSVPCEVYGVTIDVKATDDGKDIQDIIRERIGN